MSEATVELLVSIVLFLWLEALRSAWADAHKAESGRLNTQIASTKNWKPLNWIVKQSAILNAAMYQQSILFHATYLEQ